jgi:hypothetical protein
VHRRLTVALPALLGSHAARRRAATRPGSF